MPALKSSVVSRQSSEKTGFTLIELMVVISIITILTTIGLVSYSNAQTYARDSRRKNDLKAIQQSLELYYQTYNYYPPNNPGWCKPLNSASDTSVKNALYPTFINTMPTDPKGTYDYLYWQSAANSYRLYTVLESSNDSSANPGILTSDGGSSCTGYNANYNFKVTSP